MDSSEEQDLSMWPPGTVRLEDMLQRRGKDIILQPTPSDDINDPLNWSQRRKSWNFTLVAFYATMVFALINSTTPTWGPMNIELGFSYEILNDGYAVGCGTLAFGAFLLIPFALKYGRRPIYILSIAAQFGVGIWSAKIETVADYILTNAFGCGLGALAEVIVQMTVADVFFVHERGLMNTIYIWVSSIGGSLAPVAAGYITLSEGWRWVWWWASIFLGTCLILFVFSYEETKYTYPTAITGISPINSSANQDISEKAEKTAGQAAMPATESSDDVSSPDFTSSPPPINPSIPKKSYLQRLAVVTSSPGSFSKFARHSYQPAIILVTFPAVGYMSLVYGFVLSWQVIMVTILSSYMTLPPYNFDSAHIGLMSVAPFVGTTIGALITGPLSDRSILWLARRNKGIYEPEMRLWMMAPFIPFVTLGALMFGIGLQKGLSWPVVAVGYAISAFGTTPISSIALTYLTDSYTEIVGDALVGVTFTRNITGTILVFALTPWIAAVGIQNVIITVTIMGTAVLACVFVFIVWGKRFRVKTAKRYRYYAERQFAGRVV